MSRTEVKYDKYKVKAFLDTNIILEGRPLTELPWQEIDADGPIIALLTPTAIKEIDSKKQDGRIGKRARDFNRLISSVATGGAPIVIRESKPRVELALARTGRIPWNTYDDLESDDGDSCIVAEALHAKGMTDEGKLLVSHDLKPLTFAANYDLATLHVSDSWLRQMEPSPADKEVQRLKNKLAEYLVNEPELKIEIETLVGEPVSILRIETLTDVDRNLIQRKILSLNPKQNQTSSPHFVMMAFDHDETYDRRYQAYRRRIPAFVSKYEERLERLFNQAPIRIRVSNIGKMQAENLLVEVSASGGWLHDRYIWVSPRGPSAPTPRVSHLPHFSSLLHKLPAMHQPVGRHEIAFKDEPHWQSSFSATCEDFRHGQEWTFDGIVGIDSHANNTEIIVAVTASNLRGKAQAVRQIERKLETVHLSKLVDIESLNFVTNTPVDEVIRRNDEDAIDLNAFPIGEDDEGDRGN